MSIAFPGKPRRKGWIARHKILSSIIGLVLFFSLVNSCNGDDTEVGSPAPVTTSLPVPTVAISSTVTDPTSDPSAAASASAAAKKAAEKRAVEQKKAAAEAETRKKAEAKKVAAKKAAAKKAAAKKAAAKKAAAKKAAAEKAAKQRDARQQAAAEERAREEAALTFANCTAMNRKYPHGVGLPGASDDTSGTPVTSFTRNAKVYNLNSDSDRDDDGIACEKR